MAPVIVWIKPHKRVSGAAGMFPMQKEYKLGLLTRIASRMFFFISSIFCFFSLKPDPFFKTRTKSTPRPVTKFSKSNAENCTQRQCIYKYSLCWPTMRESSRRRALLCCFLGHQLVATQTQVLDFKLPVANWNTAIALRIPIYRQLQLPLRKSIPPLLMCKLIFPRI